jgi:hypothetical protein
LGAAFMVRAPIPGWVKASKRAIVSACADYDFF